MVGYTSTSIVGGTPILSYIVVGYTPIIVGYTSSSTIKIPLVLVVIPLSSLVIPPFQVKKIDPAANPSSTSVLPSSRGAGSPVTNHDYHQ